MNIYEKVMRIQIELKAPKSQFNNFGKYKYRNLEDVLEAVNPLLDKYKAMTNITDEIVLIGDRYYVKATASIKDTEKEGQVEAVAYAREDENKKGMDLSQLSGSTSSYARKYALNGLLAIDDTKDSEFKIRGNVNHDPDWTIQDFDCHKCGYENTIKIFCEVE